ncbi:MAG TPA: S8 family peptidase [Polyangia bacterium]
MKNSLAPWMMLFGVSAATVVAWRADSGLPAPAAPPGESRVAVTEDPDAEAGAASQYDLLVDFKDDLSDMDKVLAATPFDERPLSRQSAIDGLYRIDLSSLAEAQAARKALAQNPAIESVDWDAPAFLSPVSAPDDAQAAAPAIPNAACEASTPGTATAGFPDDPCYRYQWHMSQIGLPSAWKMGQGKGVTVAVIDTGVTQVPDLAGIEMVEGYNFVANNANAADDHGHGTHVAGTIAQATNNKLGVAGVAFGAKIMPLKVLSAQGSGSMGAIAQAIRYAADHGAQVINMSLGGPFPVTAIRTAVKYAKEKGVVVVAAAGNDGRGRVGYPAHYPEVFAVAATQFDETTTFYSNWGPEIDIAAPGGNVRVDQNGDGKPDGVLQNTVVPGNTSKTDYLLFMGTSMASPHVAGVAALVVGSGVTKPDAVEDLLRATARAPKERVAAAAGKENRYGAGIVDAGAALKRSKVVHGAGGVGLAGALAFLGLAGLRRRGRMASPGGGFVTALVVTAGGLFFLPLLLPGSLAASVPVAVLGSALPGVVPAAFAGFGQGNPILWGALLPVAAVAVLSGVGRLRGTLAGAAFGVAGALAVTALTGATNVAWIPDLLDRPWLVVNALACVAVGRTLLRR